MAPPPTPRTLYVLLFPGFQLMDLAGPLDILNILTLPPWSADITMKFVAQSLEPVPTKAVPPKGVSWRFDLQGVGMEGVGDGRKEDGGMGRGFCQWLTPDLSFEEVLEGKEDVDVILVPGGVGTRMYRTNNESRERRHNCQALLDFLPKIAARVRTGFMTVCTGSHLLAQAGLLDGRRATTNMLRFEDVSSQRKEVEWVRGARWVRSDLEDARMAAGKGNGGKQGQGEVEIWSSAGISAGMDLTLAFITEYFGGVEVSREIARRLEYDWAEPGEGEVCKFYGRYFGV